MKTLLTPATNFLAELTLTFSALKLSNRTTQEWLMKLIWFQGQEEDQLIWSFPRRTRTSRPLWYRRLPTRSTKCLKTWETRTDYSLRFKTWSSKISSCKENWTKMRNAWSIALLSRTSSSLLLRVTSILRKSWHSKKQLIDLFRSSKSYLIQTKASKCSQGLRNQTLIPLKR